MRVMALCGAGLLVAVAAVQAEYPDPQPRSIGVGGRAMALGGNYTALAGDLSALYYNPAGLGFTRAREVSMSLSGLALASRSTVFGETTDADQERLRFGTGGLVWAVPSKRGGLAFALGYLCPQVLDDAISWSTDSNSQVEQFELATRGQLSMWSVGFGLQVAPGLSAGLTLSLVTGSADIWASRLLMYNDTVIAQASFEDDIQRRYVGYDIRLGAMYSIGEWGAVGVRFVLPRTIKFTGEWERSYEPWSSVDSSEDYDDPGRLRGASECAVSFALKLPAIVLSPEVAFRSPNPAARRHTDGEYWKIAAGIGAELPLFRTGVLLRAGYRFSEYDDMPYVVFYGEDDAPAPAETAKKVVWDNHQITGGIAYVTKGGFSFDISYGYRLWRYELGLLEQTYGFHQVMLAAGLRY